MSPAQPLRVTALVWDACSFNTMLFASTATQKLIEEGLKGRAAVPEVVKQELLPKHTKFPIPEAQLQFRKSVLNRGIFGHTMALADADLETAKAFDAEIVKFDNYGSALTARVRRTGKDTDHFRANTRLACSGEAAALAIAKRNHALVITDDFAVHKLKAAHPEWPGVLTIQELMTAITVGMLTLKAHDLTLPRQRLARVSLDEITNIGWAAVNDLNQAVIYRSGDGHTMSANEYFAALPNNNTLILPTKALRDRMTLGAEAMWLTPNSASTTALVPLMPADDRDSLAG